MSQRDFIHVQFPSSLSSTNNQNEFIELDVYVKSAITFRDIIMGLIMGKLLKIPNLGHDLSYINHLYSQYELIIKDLWVVIAQSDYDEKITQSKYFYDIVKFGLYILGSSEMNSGFGVNGEIAMYLTFFNNLKLKHPVNGVELKLPQIAPRVMTINLMINQLINNCTIPIPANRTYYTVEKDGKETPLWYTLSQLDYRDGDVINLVKKEYLNQ